MSSGGELLQHRGIRYEAWDEYEKSSKVLPKTGKKLFDPNGSWLQHKQIEKGLQLRNDLLHIERIERKSQLSIAEWLPCENKIRVLKKLGQEWSNFGLEENGVLYLIPEEALVLLEMVTQFSYNIIQCGVGSMLAVSYRNSMFFFFFFFRIV